VDLKEAKGNKAGLIYSQAEIGSILVKPGGRFPR
jgi:hypothetical protein